MQKSCVSRRKERDRPIGTGKTTYKCCTDFVVCLKQLPLADILPMDERIGSVKTLTSPSWLLTEENSLELGRIGGLDRESK
jgi:hypothetical protein